MADFFLKLDHVSVRLGEKEILRNLHLTIHEDEQWAIVGSSGSGKTTLAHAIAGRNYFSGNIYFNGNNTSRPDTVVVDQQHRFKNLSNTSDFYYQQRYNASDSEDALLVETVLAQLTPDKEQVAGIRIDELPAFLHIDHLLKKPLIQLSNGENKRLQIAKAILQDPAFLILDNPFVGLDVDGRRILSEIIEMIRSSGVKVLLITSPTEVPDSITHVAILDSGSIVSTMKRKDFHPRLVEQQSTFKIDHAALHTIKNNSEHDFEYAIRMKNVEVKYGERIILHNINWEVKNGECWSISGPNGAGKSTLLSLITGDKREGLRERNISF